MDQPLYKYTEKKYALGMIQKGEFKIGTLDDFKKDEGYGNEIGDPREGTKSRYSTEDINTAQPSPQLEFFEQEILKRGSPNYWEMKGIKWQKSEASPNCFIYCLTDELNWASLLRMNPKYDTAVRIPNFKQFFAALTESLGAKKNIRWYGLGDCVYIADRHEHFSKPKTPPVLVKEPRHSYQREVRLVWESLDPDIVPIVITSPKARTFCSLVSDEELQESPNPKDGR